jgi:hypothetical protein
MNSSISWDITPFCVENQQKKKTRKRHQFPFPTCLMLVSCFGYSSTFKLGMTFSSYTPIGCHETTWHYVSEDRNLHNRSRENL